MNDMIHHPTQKKPTQGIRLTFLLVKIIIITGRGDQTHMHNIIIIIKHVLGWKKRGKLLLVHKKTKMKNQKYKR